MPHNPYICPVTKMDLKVTDSALLSPAGATYPILKSGMSNAIPVFVDESLLSGGDKISQTMYKKTDAESFYENFLSWLFATFKQDEAEFRNSLIEKLNLKEGDRVLVTGCGLGDDLVYILPKIGSNGELFAQDISDLMIAASARRLCEHSKSLKDNSNVYLSVSNASELPYANAYFDAAYHFGGINLFSNMKSAINEMARVVKAGGKVLIGDEGIAPWLKETTYGKAVVCNNQLWASEPPLSLLPETAKNVHLSWTLGNCFYVIDFEVSDSIPEIDMDIPHKGIRGGSIRTRYFGQLEGVNPELKEKIRLAALGSGTSSSAWLESLISKALTDNKFNNE